MKKAILAAGAILAGALGMGDTQAVLQEQPRVVKEITNPYNTEGGNADGNYTLSHAKGGKVPFYAHIQYKRKKRCSKITVKKIS